MGAAKGSVPWNAGAGRGWTDDREKDHAVDFYARITLCAEAFDKARTAIAKATGAT